MPEMGKAFFCLRYSMCEHDQSLAILSRLSTVYIQRILRKSMRTCSPGKLLSGCFSKLSGLRRL